MATYQLHINGKNHEVDAVPETPLLWIHSATTST